MIVIESENVSSFESYFEDIIDGLILKFGVATGGTIRKIALVQKERPIYGFDWFQGLPENWRVDIEKGSFACDVPTALPENVHIVNGLFEQTLPSFLEEHKENISIVHIDCDLYSSTKTVFNNIKNRIVPGTKIIFDEICNFPGWEKHEYKAFCELAEQRPDLEFNIIGRHGPEQRGYVVSKKQL